ncbi:very short patch repair endonuclease [Nocardiopsis ganjiahuensis]|uniref:very short patch repair endonuclease n=1 Tax=Nocardiopsis ganjiahuensis TaxID=239984 RepID=UPI0003480EAE|nr:very short patch repair endonuclease [Nocardiopsis ganjiahuensis]
MDETAGAGEWAAPEGSWASSAANRRSMRANRSRDTKPEVALRRLVHAAGLRYRVAAKPLPKMRRTADLLFRPVRVAVFVDGCFWHGCPDHFVFPKTNPAYWEEKIAGNTRRDRDTDTRLQEAGWLVLRFWEHQDPASCAETVVGAVSARKAELARPRLDQ